MKRTFNILLCFVLHLALGGACWALAAAPQEPSTVEGWLRRAAIPLDNQELNSAVMKGIFDSTRVVALGEATHGQHEVFDIKRQITMHLVRSHQFRLVAYEASSSKILQANEYISGRSNDRKRAMSGFGMLIWQIEENAELLDALREWNKNAKDEDQVRLIGFDAQDSDASMNRLIELLGPGHSETIEQIRKLVPRAQKAIADLMTGNRENWDELLPACEALRVQILEQGPLREVDSAEFDLRLKEYMHSLTMYASRGGRDKAMADLTIEQLNQSGPNSKCVILAHNGHIQRCPLAYLGTNELAMGGHLGAHLGNDYYAIGVAFGEGEFQANAQDSNGKWGFRRYHLSPAPIGSLEWMLGKAGHQRYIVDLLGAPKIDAVQQWLQNGHGQRWFGGYSVSDDCDAMTRDASKLLTTTPAQDFDGLIYVANTRAAQPIDTDRILPAK